MPKKWRKKHKAGIQEGSDQTRATAKIDHAFVSSGQRSTGSVLPSVDRKMAGLIILALVLIGGGAAYLYFANRTEPIAQGPKCSTQILQRSASRLHAEAVADLEPITKEIESIRGYEEDPNCLYILTAYAINMSDAEQANRHFNNLQKVYNAETGYDPIIRRNAKTPKELQPIVSFLNKEAARYKKIGPDGAPQ